MKSWEYLNQARKTLGELREIRMSMDPASGVSFAVRRGVARDNEDLEEDAVSRPWVTVETSELIIAASVIDSLTEAVTKSIDFWGKVTRKDILDAQAAIEAK